MVMAGKCVRGFVVKKSLALDSKYYINAIKAAKEDLLVKFNREDWHGVADAAMDLREYEAHLEELEHFESINTNATI